VGIVTDVIEELYAQSVGRLGAYGFMLTGSQSAGEELVQEAIVKVFVRKKKLDNVRMAESYVRTTMQRLYIDRIRRDATWRRLVPGQARADQRPDTADDVAAADAAARALALLPPRVRTAIVLRYLDGLAVAEIADSMGLSGGTVKRYLSDGRALLGPAMGVAEDASTDDAAPRIAVVESGGK